MVNKTGRPLSYKVIIYTNEDFYNTRCNIFLGPLIWTSSQKGLTFYKKILNSLVHHETNAILVTATDGTILCYKLKIDKKEVKKMEKVTYIYSLIGPGFH